MDNQLEALRADDRIPANPLITRLEMPNGGCPQRQSNPFIAAAGNLIERASFGTAGAEGMFGIQQSVEAFPGHLLAHNVDRDGEI